MDLTITQQILVGMIQGITEWIPISSSGFLALIFANFFNVTDLSVIIQSILWLHLGTFFAALIYFRKDVAHLFVSLFQYRKSDKPTQRTLNFLIISTIISGIIGFIILLGLGMYEDKFTLTGKTISLAVGILLLITGILQLRVKKNNSNLRKLKNLNHSDSLLLGFAQGLSSLPGLSRSGITVSTLMLRKFDDTTALRLSFLMSLPIVLIGNIILNIPDFNLGLFSIWSLVASFAFGLLTIHVLMKLSKKINFGWFVLIFAILMILSFFL
jgi:undecaprenyl-diphosphatase